jgi:hypothetical protein
MNQRKKLADILQLNSAREAIEKAWETTEAAGDFAPLPKGEYPCRVLSGELFNAAKKGTAGYKLVFQVVEGPYANRRIWHDLWLTPAALPQTKRDLLKLGITSLEQLERPLPPGILVKVQVILRKNDDGSEYNKVRSFEVTGTEPGDAFEPSEETTPSTSQPDTLFDPALLDGKPAVEESPVPVPPRRQRGKQSSVEANGSYLEDKR